MCIDCHVERIIEFSCSCLHLRSYSYFSPSSLLCCPPRPLITSSSIFFSFAKLHISPSRAQLLPHSFSHSSIQFHALLSSILLKSTDFQLSYMWQAADFSLVLTDFRHFWRERLSWKPFWNAFFSPFNHTLDAVLSWFKGEHAEIYVCLQHPLFGVNCLTGIVHQTPLTFYLTCELWVNRLLDREQR